MGKLKVTFDGPKAGGVWINLQSAAQSVSISATYIYNGFFPLVDALSRMWTAPGEATVCWQCEPSEVEMRFRREAEIVSLEVVWFPDGRRSIFTESEPDLSASGSYEEICLPFWRALRSLQGRFSVSEFEERWHGSFPTQELASLMRLLDK